MTIPSLPSTTLHATAEFEALVQTIRPELHRYCTRMIGSVVDAEDIVQDALAQAYASIPTTLVANMRGWLFRIAHNKAIDYLRRSNHQPMEYLDEQALFVEPDQPLVGQELVALALSVFLKLTPKQRSCVVLKDVMDYSLADISILLDASIPEIKAALHRGRTRLRELSKNLTLEAPQPSNEQQRELLERYIERFNARDFDAVRAMLADEVRLDLINRLSRRGRAEVGKYFHRYDQNVDWYLVGGTVENRPAILVYDDRERASLPAYFVLLGWQGGQVAEIRDYRYARYVMQNAVIGAE